MILKYLWARLHRPFIAVVAYLTYLVFTLWLIRESLLWAGVFLAVSAIIGVLYLYWDEIYEDYQDFKGGQ
jgi:hypothetical protein